MANGNGAVGPVSLSQLKSFSRITFERAKSRATHIPSGGAEYWKYLTLEHKLLDDIEVKAPGTLRHSLMVANIAAAAAFRIGADADLARAIGLFHDIFKGNFPHLFFEALTGEREKEGRREQIEVRSLEDLEVIMSHPVESANILKRSGFPEKIWRGVSEHHGDLKTKVDMSPDLKKMFDLDSSMETRYLHYTAKPSSRESAIVLLADRAEAVINRILSENHLVSPGEDFVQGWVKTLGEDARTKGQFVKCGLTVSAQTIVEEKISWWLYRYYNDLDITGTPPRDQILAVAVSPHNLSLPRTD